MPHPKTIVIAIILVLAIGIVMGYTIGYLTAPSPASTTPTPTTPSPTETKTPTETVVPFTPTLAGLKVAAIYVTPLEEPWNTALHLALTWAHENLGIEYNYVEQVSEADFERVVRGLIAAGYKVVFAHSWGYNEVTRRLATEFPDVFFLQGSGPAGVEWPKNVLVYDYYIQDAAFVAGALAGLMTRSNVVGVVAAFPVEDVNILVNAFIAGARYTNPSVQAKVIFIESWFDATKARVAASTLIAEGADLIYAERYGVFEACRDAVIAGKMCYAFGNIVDQNSLAPDVVLGSVVWDLRPFIKHVLENYVAGTLEGGKIVMWGMREGWARFVWNERLKQTIPRDILLKVEGVEYSILKEEFSVPVYRDWKPERWA